MTQKRRKPEGYDDMTHEELLAYVTTEVNNWSNLYGVTNSNLEALRAVVKLHKPVTEKQGLVLCSANCEEEYPCTTIQAIMGEIK